MGRPRKPDCYLERFQTGHFCFKPIIEWVAFDYWRQEVARAKTKKECEKRAREAGYAPR